MRGVLSLLLPHLIYKNRKFCDDVGEREIFNSLFVIVFVIYYTFH